MKTDEFNKKVRQTPIMANLEPRQSHTSFERCRVFGCLDHSLFLRLACFIIVMPRSEFDVEDVRLQEPMG